MVKPDTITSMLLSLYIPHEPITTLILRISDLSIEHEEGKPSKLVLKHKLLREIPDVCDLMIAYADDPTILHAGDWGNLGTSRILVQMTNAVLNKEKSDVIEWTGKLGEINIIIPERCPVDNTKADFFI